MEQTPARGGGSAMFRLSRPTATAGAPANLPQLTDGLPTVQPGKYRGPETDGGRTGSCETPHEHQEKSTITVVVRPAVAAAGEVPIDGRGLFRRKLAVQIFPQSLRDVGTLHSHLVLIAPGSPTATPC